MIIGKPDVALGACFPMKNELSGHLVLRDHSAWFDVVQVSAHGEPRSGQSQKRAEQQQNQTIQDAEAADTIFAVI